MKLLCYSLCLLFAVPVLAQTNVDSSRLMKDVRTLSEDKYEGRKTGTPGNRLAQFYIIDRFKKAGLTPYHGTYEYPFYFQAGGRKIMGTNLYGYIPGSSKQAIVISAHYDHLGTISRSSVRDTIYNGADDNASGIGGLLAIMEYFIQHPPRHTIIIAAFDAEEVGLRGAEAFVQQPPVPITDIIQNLNMDMISHNNKKELYVCGTSLYPALKKMVDPVAATSSIKIIAGHDKPGTGSDDWTFQSDQGPFHKQKIPFLYFGVEDHPDYHQVTDEYTRINYSFYYQAVKAILAISSELDKQL